MFNITFDLTQSILPDSFSNQFPSLTTLKWAILFKLMVLDVFKHFNFFCLNCSLPNPFFSFLLAEILLFHHSILNVISYVKLSQVLILRQSCYFLLTAMILRLNSIIALSSVNLNETKSLKLLNKEWSRIIGLLLS